MPDTGGILKVLALDGTLQLRLQPVKVEALCVVALGLGGEGVELAVGAMSGLCRVLVFRVWGVARAAGIAAGVPAGGSWHARWAESAAEQPPFIDDRSRSINLSHFRRERHDMTRLSRVSLCPGTEARAAKPRPRRRSRLIHAGGTHWVGCAGDTWEDEALRPMTPGALGGLHEAGVAWNDLEAILDTKGGRNGSTGMARVRTMAATIVCAPTPLIISEMSLDVGGELALPLALPRT